MFRTLVSLFVVLIVMISWNLESAGFVQVDTVRPQGLSLSDVLKLVHSGLSEEIIVTRIKRNARPFDLSVDELLELKEQGVSDTIIKYLLDPSAPYAPAAPPPPPPAAPPTASAPPAPTPSKKYPDDPLAPKAPTEPGAYLSQNGDWIKLELKTLIAAKQGGGMGSILSAGLVKTKLRGYLIGAAAKTRVDSPPATFYLRLAEPANIEDIALVALEVKTKDKRRELEFSSNKGEEAKLNLNVESMRQFETVEVGPKLYRITPPPNLVKGQYLFYLMGSADPKKGNHGKGYDFGWGP